MSVTNKCRLKKEHHKSNLFVCATMWTSDDIICGDKYLTFALKHEPVTHYHKFDFITQPGVWRGKHVPACTSIQCNQLLLGHSDYALTDAIADLCFDKCKASHIWSVNCITTKANCHPLPLGITNLTNETHLHPIYGNVDIMEHVSKQPQVFDVRDIYCNVNISTNPSYRKPIVDMFSSQPNVTMGTINNSLEGRKQFLHQMRSHRFTVAPAGMGVDTHRLWEALYMGSIPIVQRSPIHRDWEDLPIAFVDHWHDVTKTWCDTQYEQHKDKFKDPTIMKKITIQHWLDTIASISI
jgi:hypothetical protein